MSNKFSAKWIFLGVGVLICFGIFWLTKPAKRQAMTTAVPTTTAPVVASRQNTPAAKQPQNELQDLKQQQRKIKDPLSSEAYDLFKKVNEKQSQVVLGEFGRKNAEKFLKNKKH